MTEIGSRARLALALTLLTGPHATANPGPQKGWTTGDGRVIDVAELEGARLADPATAAELLLDQLDLSSGAGVAVCATLGGEPLFAGARGHADLEHGVPASTDTVFDMASVSKSLTAFAVARLARAGELDLDAHVRDVVPGLSEAYAEVTLRQLVHHTAGVEDVEGLLALAGWRSGDAGTFEDALRILKRTDHLRFEPGTREGYSNGGYVLLASAVEQVTGTPFPEWARREVFGPLEMSSARVLDARPSIVADRAMPYGVEGGERVRKQLTTRYGAGGLACSVTDLARWGEELRAGWVFGEDLAGAMRERGRLADGTLLDYAFGIARSTEGGRERWQHAGSHPGGQSYLAFWPEEGLVVAAATNSIEGPNASRIAADVANLFLQPVPDQEAPEAPRMMLIPATQEAPPASRGVDVDADLLARYAGTYEMEDDSTLLFAADGERLLIGFGHTPEIEVFPLPSGRFIMPPVNYELSFDLDEDSVTLHVTEDSLRRSDPHDVVGRRVVERSFSPSEAATFVGTYHSPELDAYYHVVHGPAGHLVLEHGRHGTMPLVALGTDVYGIAGRSISKLTFQRQGETVVGFELEAYSWSATSRFVRI